MVLHKKICKEPYLAMIFAIVVNGSHNKMCFHNDVVNSFRDVALGLHNFLYDDRIIIYRGVVNEGKLTSKNSRSINSFHTIY
jgi:hypothetical protein